jgi:hypothetical protein
VAKESYTIKINYHWSVTGVDEYDSYQFVMANQTVGNFISIVKARVVTNHPEINFNTLHDITISFNGALLLESDNKILVDTVGNPCQLNVKVTKKEFNQTSEIDENLRLKLVGDSESKDFHFTVSGLRLVKSFQNNLQEFINTNAFSKFTWDDMNGVRHEGNETYTGKIKRYDFYFDSSKVSEDDQQSLLEDFIAVVKKYRSTINRIAFKDVNESTSVNCGDYNIRNNINTNQLMLELLGLVKDFCQKKNIQAVTPVFVVTSSSNYAYIARQSFHPPEALHNTNISPNGSSSIKMQQEYADHFSL